MPRRFLQLVLVLFFCAAPLAAQGPSDLPPLEIENVTVIGRRMVVLPKARKGEVYDTTLYTLPPGDTLLFGERISNLGGTGGTLPVFGEFESPLKLDAEASFGSFLSPRALVRAEYIRPTFDVTGTVDYRGTAGHVDSAEASSLLIGASISKAFGDAELPLNRFRLFGGFERLGDSYFLYGNTVTPFDRSRAITRFNIGLRSEEDLPVEFSIDFGLDHSSVEDRDVDTLRDVSATTPAFSADVAAIISDSTLRATGGVDFLTTSMNYSMPTLTPAYFSVRGGLEWRPSPGLMIAGGVFYANGEHSDSGSTSLGMLRLAARYEVTRDLSLFAWFAPELRAPTYRERIMHAPYVDREIVLRPERVPVLAVAGVRFGFADMAALEIRGRYETAEATPVIVATAPGDLTYAFVDSRTVGIEGSIRMKVARSVTVTGDVIFRTAVEDSTDEQLPMTPAIDVRGRLDFALSPELDIFGSLVFQSVQQTALGQPAFGDIPARFLLGGGAAYRLMENLQAFAEISNLLNYKYDLWQNYSAPGLEVRGGVRMTF